MNQIKNYNADRLCNHQFCGEVPEWFDYIEINGIPIYIALCTRHKEMWEQNYAES